MDIDLHMYLYILMVSLSMFTLSDGIDPCAPNLKPLSTDFRPNPRFVLSGQIVIPTYSFACSGVVTSWEAKVNGQTLSTIHFQVWRFNSSLNIHHLVGENVINSIAGSEDISVSLRGSSLDVIVANPLKQIHVSTGDLIGVFVGSEHNFKIQYELSMDTITYAARVQRPLEGFVSPLIDPAFEKRLNAAPQINVKVMEAAAETTTALSTTNTASPPHTHAPDPATNKADLPYTLIAGVTVTGAVLVAVCIGLIAVIICYIKVKKSNRNNTEVPPTNVAESQPSILLPSLNTPRRNFLMAFKKQQSVRGTPSENTSNSRPIVPVDLRATANQLTTAGDLELSYAYPITERSILQARSTSSSLPSRKPNSHANIPLPEIPNVEIDVKENPSYSLLSTESFDEPERSVMATTTRDFADGDNVYDVPVFSQQSVPPLEYEVPMSSLSSSAAAGLNFDSPPVTSHLYESTDDLC